MVVGWTRAADLNRVYYFSIFPNTLLSLHPDYVMVHTLWPKAPDRTRVVCERLFSPEALGNMRSNPRNAIEF
ncbi:MAG: hypothetical protein IBX69_15110 [Anaerolineales bacterium]|nr:hypothetical protein [Anaerolineales bacterium]